MKNGTRVKCSSGCCSLWCRSVLFARISCEVARCKSGIGGGGPHCHWAVGTWKCSAAMGSIKCPPVQLLSSGQCTWHIAQCKIAHLCTLHTGQQKYRKTAHTTLSGIPVQADTHTSVESKHSEKHTVYTAHSTPSTQHIQFTAHTVHSSHSTQSGKHGGQKTRGLLANNSAVEHWTELEKNKYIKIDCAHIHTHCMGNDPQRFLVLSESPQKMSKAFANANSFLILRNFMANWLAAFVSELF